jgi:hypothetical protein
MKRGSKNKISAKRKLTDTEKLYIKKNKEKEKHYKKLEEVVNATNEFQERIIDEKREAAFLTAKHLEKQMRLIHKIIQLIDELLQDEKTPRKDKILLSRYRNLWSNDDFSTKKTNAKVDNDDMNFEDLRSLFENIFGDLIEEENEKQETEEKNKETAEQKNQEESPYEETDAVKEKQEIRKLYIKLANRFHPDKVLDAETQTQNAEIMKKLNKAYQEGNYQQLLILEKQFAQSSVVTQKALLELKEEIDETKLSDLDTQIEKLKQQIEKAKIKKKNLEKSEDGKFVKEIDRNLKKELPKFWQIELEFKDIFAELEYLVKLLEKYKTEKKSYLLSPLYSGLFSSFPSF